MPVRGLRRRTEVAVMRLTDRERLSEILARLGVVTMQTSSTTQAAFLDAEELRELRALGTELRLDVLTEKRRLGLLPPEQEPELYAMLRAMYDAALAGVPGAGGTTP